MSRLDFSTLSRTATFTRHNVPHPLPSITATAEASPDSTIARKRNCRLIELQRAMPAWKRIEIRGRTGDSTRVAHGQRPAENSTARLAFLEAQPLARQLSRLKAFAQSYCPAHRPGSPNTIPSDHLLQSPVACLDDTWESLDVRRCAGPLLSSSIIRVVLTSASCSSWKRRASAIFEMTHLIAKPGASGYRPGIAVVEMSATLQNRLATSGSIDLSNRNAPSD